MLRQEHDHNWIFVAHADTVYHGLKKRYHLIYFIYTDMQYVNVVLKRIIVQEVSRNVFQKLVINCGDTASVYQHLHSCDACISFCSGIKDKNFMLHYEVSKIIF